MKKILSSVLILLILVTSCGCSLLFKTLQSPKEPEEENVENYRQDDYGDLPTDSTDDTSSNSKPNLTSYTLSEIKNMDGITYAIKDGDKFYPLYSHENIKELLTANVALSENTKTIADAFLIPDDEINQITELRAGEELVQFSSEDEATVHPTTDFKTTDLTYIFTSDGGYLTIPGHFVRKPFSEFNNVSLDGEDMMTFFEDHKYLLSENGVQEQYMLNLDQFSNSQEFKLSWYADNADVETYTFEPDKIAFSFKDTEYTDLATTPTQDGYFIVDTSELSNGTYILGRLRGAAHRGLLKIDK